MKKWGSWKKRARRDTPPCKTTRPIHLVKLFTDRTLAQLRTNKSPILISYLHKVDETHHPSPLCPLCKTHPHTTDHLFNCTIYIPQATYWTSGCLPREWRPCWSGGRDAWQGFSRETGLSDPSTATRRRGRSITTIDSNKKYFNIL